MDQYAGSPDHTTYCYEELAAYKIQKNIKSINYLCQQLTGYQVCWFFHHYLANDTDEISWNIY